MSKDTSVVGDLINFRGLVYAPLNENGVIYLFGKVTEDLHMYVEEIKPGFPDCIARRFTGKGWERIRVEFELKSSHFAMHGHDPQDCDVIVCWEHDWKDSPIEVIELRSAIEDMENFPIKRPGTTQDEPDFDKTMDALFDRAESQEEPRKWWAAIHKALQEHDAEIWLNIGRIYVGLYSPERSFASVKPTKTAIHFECFTRGQAMQGAKVSSAKYSPRWGRFVVKQESQIELAIKSLIQAQTRLKEAIKAGERTSYYSGGQGFGKEPPEEELEETEAQSK
jgi:hypothetical protein